MRVCKRSLSVMNMGPSSYGLMASPQDIPTISEIMHSAIAERAFPGGVVAFGSCTVPCYYQAYGTYTFESSIAVRSESVWDMSSLTKIMVTTPSVMLLFDRGLLELDELACNYVPEFGNNGKEVVTIKHLLTHTAGLREFYSFFDMGLQSRQQVLDYILKDKLWYEVGGMARYSDLSMIVLGLVVERISGVCLHTFASTELFEPLGMQNTGFRPTEFSDFDPMVVPTEVDRVHRNRLLWGEVHDSSAFLLGGVAGHAGLFSTIIDVCKFAQMMLAGGMNLARDYRILTEKTVRLFMTPDVKTSINSRPFALGWDVAVRRSVDGYSPAGKLLGPQTFGHTGFTGTSLWIDPDCDLFVALLTNAVHPIAVDGSGSKVREVRHLIADAAVYTMREQANPRNLLIWHHVESITREKNSFVGERITGVYAKDVEVVGSDNSHIETWNRPTDANEICTQGFLKQKNWESDPGSIVNEHVTELPLLWVPTMPSKPLPVNEGMPSNMRTKVTVWKKLMPILLFTLVANFMSGL